MAPIALPAGVVLEFDPDSRTMQAIRSKENAFGLSAGVVAHLNVRSNMIHHVWAEPQLQCQGLASALHAAWLGQTGEWLDRDWENMSDEGISWAERDSPRL